MLETRPRAGGADRLKSERTISGIGHSISEVPPTALRTPLLGISGESKMEEGDGEVDGWVPVENPDGDLNV